MIDDDLDASKMNVNPGGKQRIMRDTVWQDRVQKMNYSYSVATKGMYVVLQERGVVDTSQIVAEDTRKALVEGDGGLQDWKTFHQALPY